MKNCSKIPSFFGTDDGLEKSPTEVTVRKAIREIFQHAKPNQEKMQSIIEKLFDSKNVVHCTYYVKSTKLFMIRSFKNKDTRKLYEGERVKKWHGFINQAERRLEILDSATCIEDLMNLPSNRFEALIGDRKGQYSISINMQWRICFEWIDNEPHHVEIVDYH